MGKHGKFFRWASAFVLILTMFSSILTSASATENVCGPLDSGKIDTSGDPASVTIEAPDGYLIDGYCVKAGSANQGYGPEYVSIEPVGSVTISHSSGKSVSHYSYSLVPIDTPSEPTLVTPLIPAVTPSEVCGVIGTATPVPMDGVLYSEVWYEGNTAFVIATPAEGFVFADGVTSLTLQADVTPATECPPELIEVTPLIPTVTPSEVCGVVGTATPVPVNGVLYGEVWYEGNTAFVIATPAEGFVFAGGATSITLQVDVTPATECPPELIEVTPVAPAYEPSLVCGVLGTVTEATTTGVIYTRTVSVDGNFVTITATADVGYTLVGQAVFGPFDISATKCPPAEEPSVTPVPSVTPATPSPTETPASTPVPAEEIKTTPTPTQVTVAPQVSTSLVTPVASTVTTLPDTGSGPGESSSTWPLFAAGALVLLAGGVFIDARRREA